MSLGRQLTPAILRHVLPSLYGSCAVSSPAITSSSVRYASRSSTTPHKLNNFDLKDMLGKALDIKGSKSPATMWVDKSNNLKLSPPPNAWTGRRLTIRNGDLNSTFQLLNSRLRLNNVAKEIALTVRHEKKGDKRARLRSERWRKRFADTVRRRVQLVSTIRRRGG